MAASEAQVWAALRAAWEEAFPGAAFTPDQSWRETGLDSLKALGLALRVEIAIGRRVPYEGLGAESTPRDLVDALFAEAPARASADARPHVFLVPGLFGDEPRLADLRRATADLARFTVVDLPGVEAPSTLLASIPKTAAHVADVVAVAQPQGELRLAGYSFGALVAQEAARLLEARGRRVARLVALDGLVRLRPRDADAIGLARPPHPRSARRKPSDLEHLAFAALFTLHLTEPARRLLLRVSPRRDPLWTLERSRWIVSRLRGWAVLRWRPRPCAAPTLLVESRDFARFSSEAAWRRACPDLTAAAVDARHLGLFEPQALAVLRPALAAALRE